MLRRKEKDDQILLKMRCWYLKTLRMENLMTWKHFKNQKLENHFKTWLRNYYLKSKGKILEGWHVAQRVPIPRWPSSGNGCLSSHMLCGPCSPFTACSYQGAIRRCQFSVWWWISIQHCLLSWNRTSDISIFKAALNAKWNTKPINSRISHMSSSTVNCTPLHSIFLILCYQYTILQILSHHQPSVEGHHHFQLACAQTILVLRI